MVRRNNTHNLCGWLSENGNKIRKGTSFQFVTVSEKLSGKTFQYRHCDKNKGWKLAMVTRRSSAWK